MGNPFSEDLSRRVFVKDLGFVSLGLLLGTLGGCEELAEAIRNRPVRRRLRIGSAAVDADIATYKHAVELMKALPSSDPRSWISQATIHGVPAHFNFCQHGTVHFFDWHRAYLFFFEKICQKLTGNAKFGLPYWNWNQNPDINPAFLDPTSTLYLARARTSMTGSSSITTAALDPIFADTNFFTFGSQIEGTPHNNVHTYIGGTLGGFASAQDPLFWMHHCMVDYCWAKWNIEMGNNNTNDSAWVNTVNSHFVDADGNTATETAIVTTIMPLLSYQYESSAIGSSPAVAAIRTKREYQKLEKRIKEGANIKFDVKQRIRIAEKAAVSIAKPVSIETRLSASDFATILNSDAVKERVFVNINFAQLPATSDFAVRVFIDLPSANSSTPTDDPHFAGSFAFFGTSLPNEPAAAGGEHQGKTDFLVNITPTLQKLRRNQELRAGSPFSVQLVPAPFAGKFEREDTRLLLEKIDIITTPVIINSPQ
jgi:tyrosinase